MSLRLSTAVSLLAICLPPICVSAQTVIPAGSGNYNANTAGSYIVNSGDTRTASGSTTTVDIGSATGPYTLTVNGTVSQTGTGRAIRTSANNVTFNITVGATGVVKAIGDDAFQARGGIINFTNLGTLYSGANLAATPTTAIATGRGFNARDAASGTITNGSTTNSTALIRADGADAVRVGANISFTNYGIILAAGVVNDSSANNVFNASPNNNVTKTYTAGAGFSFEDPSGSVGSTNSSLDNYGTITGTRHGVQAGVLGSNLTVTNRATGQIIGKNGSGVGFDTTTTDPTKIVVNNYGLIRGDYAGAGNIIDQTGNASPTNDGDGDGVDIDGAATINNYSTGQILSTGAGGFDSDGRANNSEAISIGGGVIVNDGIIRGSDRGIVVNNDSNVDRSGVAATTITNNSGATIEGQNGYAIRLENKLGDARDNDTITNAGTIIGNGSIPNPSGTVLRQDGLLDPNSTGTLDGVAYTGTGSGRFIQGDGSAIQMGEGDDVLTNTGAITGNTGRAINMEGGNDIVNFNAGTITGEINGGAGTDTLNLGASVSTASAIKSFENVNVASGSATLSGVVSGNTLTKGGTGTLVLANDNTYTGQTTVTAGGLRVDNASGSATGAGNVVVNSGAKLTGGGIIGGNVTLDGILDPGNIVGTLTVNGTVTWNGDITNAWQFDLSTGNASDRLLVGGDFTKGLGSDFVFDFKGGAVGGTFTLVGWNGTTNFTSTDFHYVNLGAGYTASFAISGNELQLTTAVVPEPATYAAFFSAGVLAFAVWRRRASASGRKL
jgi:autotransporter-associated beta strand protein